MRRDELLDLNDVLQHPGREVAVDISTELPDEADIDLAAPLEGFLEAVSTGNLLLLSGEFKTKMVLECSRCGEPIEYPIEFELDEQFGTEGTPSSLNPREMAKVVSDEPHALFDGNQLIVEALLRQDLLINIPMRPLCEDVGKPVCTAPVSRKQADSSRPEFQKLAQFKHKEDGE